jgi:crotonobetainyl-CoA:carnitine CoA-transferase CaiB-like acyl-CoA transferase
VPVSSVEDAGDHHQDPVTRATWATMTLPSGITAEVLHAPVTWDGERLPLRRAPLWMEHTHEVLVGELGVDPARFAELADSQVLW